MAKHVLLLFHFFLLALVRFGSPASISPEEYWNLKLPNTLMPQTIKQSLASRLSTPGGRAAEMNELFLYSEAILESLNGYTGLFSYGNGESFLVNDDVNSVAKDQMFFVEKDLYSGKKITVHFQKSKSKGMFLPRQVSNKIPFSSDKLQEIRQMLHLDPNSKEAYDLAKRVAFCEDPNSGGFEKKCVTSLESMVDFVTSMIGANVNALTTPIEKNSKMDYTIKGVKKLVKDDHETVICHKLGHPYAVYFCHRWKIVRSYMVSLVDKDGNQIEAVAACHKETNDFFDNYAKNVLNVKPGSTHICHFAAAEDTIVWVPKY